MKKLIGYFIIIPTVALSCLGNFGLYGNQVEGLTPRNLVVLLVSLGIELALVLLTHEAAKRVKMVEDFTRTFTLALMFLLLSLSTIGQYCFLLKGAVGHEITLTEAQETRQDSSTEKEVLRKEQAQLMEAMAAEQKTGWGKKADGIAARLDAVKAQLAGLDVKKEKAVETVAGTSELLVACAEFGLPIKTTIKTAVGVFVLVANLAGFWLLFLSYLDKDRKVAVVREFSAPVPQPSAAPRQMPQPESFPPAYVLNSGMSQADLDGVRDTVTRTLRELVSSGQLYSTPPPAPPRQSGSPLSTLFQQPSPQSAFGRVNAPPSNGSTPPAAPAKEGHPIFKEA
jgi:hypothetical protein